MFETIQLIWSSYSDRYVLDDNHYLFLSIYRHSSLRFYLFNDDELLEIKLSEVGLKHSIINRIEYVVSNWDNIDGISVQLCNLNKMTINQYWSEAFYLNKNGKIYIEANWVSGEIIESISNYILNISNLGLSDNIHLDNWSDIL